MRLQQGRDDPPVLLESLSILGENLLIVLLQKLLARASRWIDPNGLREKEDEFLPGADGRPASPASND